MSKETRQPVSYTCGQYTSPKMSTEVSSLPSHQLLPAPKVGAEFLASSHFAVAQEPRVTQKSLKSIFKKDYIPHDVFQRPDASVPPPPADVMHKDDRYFNNKASETVKSYPRKNLHKPELRNVYAALSQTNFKMDSDLGKFDSFHTTHNMYFIPQPDGAVVPSKFKKDRMKSFIPQGDPEKSPQPYSDYKDHYRGHDTSLHVIDKAPCMHTGGLPTITGDGRLHQFDTTHGDTFRGRWLPRIRSLSAPVGTNVPGGDRGKERTSLTTQQECFGPVDTAVLGHYDKASVMGKLQLTNFQQNDGHNTWNTYLSTQTESYRPMYSAVSRSAPAHHRNHSDLPEGDEDPNREASRINMTTSRFYHGKVPRYGYPTIESGANKRTKSNVWFGEPTLGGIYYDSTMDSTFRAVDSRHQTPRKGITTQSDVPMDYYPNEVNRPVTWNDFQDPMQGKVNPNPRAVARIRQSHIQPPLSGGGHFNTEHLDQYKPKDSARSRVQDPGKLQRSSVPLGTMTI